MSTEVDNRVVEMQFDNRDFEKNVSTSMKTIDDLKKSLNFEGAAKGLSDVNSAANQCDMSTMSKAVDTIKLKFSSLQVMATTALANITNSAVNAGKRIVSALTIDPIKTGFSEYETQINAIQTILANTSSKGTNLDDVNSALDELNTYADKTIYNFTEMTRNIGTFTAAGVDLDTSVSAIKGIANLAAVSGSTSQQASTAMYQLSQALSSGTVRLMDWNSVVNAGMGGQVFQDALKDTARVHGIAIDDIIEKQGSFRESLSEGWLSSEILTETLAKFTGDLTEEQLKSMGYTDKQIEGIIKMGKTANDAATKVKTFTQLFDTLKEAAQSGWTQTWEIIVGDFEEAKELLTRISDVIGGFIGKSAEARNEMLENWKVLGGRTALIDAFKNAFEGVISIITPIKEAFREIFPPLTSEKLFAFTEGLRDLAAKLKISDETSDKLKRTFKGLFAVVDIIGQAFKAAFKAIGPLFGIVGDLGGGILDVAAGFGDWLVVLNDWIKKSDVFGIGLRGVVSGIKMVYDYLKKAVNWVKDKFVFPAMEIFQTQIDGIYDRFSKLGEAASSVRSKIVTALTGAGEGLENSPIFRILSALWTSIIEIGSAIGKAFGKITEGLFTKIVNGDFNVLIEFVNSIISGGIGIAIMNFINNLNKGMGSVSDFVDGFKSIVTNVGDCLAAFQSQIQAAALIKIAIAVGILAASIFVLASLDADSVANGVTALGMLFAELLVAMNVFMKMGKGVKGAFTSIYAMIGMSVAVLILASALKTIGDLSLGEVLTALVGIGGLMVLLKTTAKKLGSDKKSIFETAASMVVFAVAIKVLASACNDLAYLDWDELAKGLIGVGVLIGEVILFTQTAKFSNNMWSTCISVVALAASIKILASACKDFSMLSWEEIGRGLVGVAGAMATIVLALRFMPANPALSAVSMIALSASLLIIAIAFEQIGGMDWETIGKGLVVLGGSLAALAIGLKAMNTSMLGSAALVVAALALRIFVPVLASLGSMSWESISKALVALGIGLAELAIGLYAMSGTIYGAAGLAIAAVGLNLLIPVLKTLGSMSWESLVKGIVALAAAFAVIGVAAWALSYVIGPMMALSVAMALLGVGVLALGAGLTMFGGGLSAVGVGLTALFGSLGVIASGIVDLIKSIVVGILNGIAEAIVSFCDIIVLGLPAVAEALIAIIVSLCQVLLECAPVLVDTLLKLVVILLDALVEYSPSIVGALFRFLIGLINSLAEYTPDLIVALTNLLNEVFGGVIEAVSKLDAKTILSGSVALLVLSHMLVMISSFSALLPGAIAGVISLGVLIAEIGLVIAAFGAIAQIPGVEWIINEGGDLLENIGVAIGKFVGGLAGGIASGFTSQLPQIGHDLSTFMTNLKPFIEGAKTIDASVLEGAIGIAGVILALTAANVLDGLTSWFTGGTSIADFGAEIAEFGPHLKTYADAVAGIDPEAVKTSVTAAKALVELAKEVPNEGGVVGWFAGENSIAKFGKELVDLGKGLKGFANETSGINTETIIAASNAAKVLAEMTACIPNEGGVVAWFAGENSIARFSSQLIGLGKGLKGFATETEGINPEVLTATANAAKVLAEMTECIPNEGGLTAWISGDNSVSKFGNDLTLLGRGLKSFATETEGVNPETVTAAANAAKALADMTAAIPAEGGITAWFAGERSVSKFSSDLTTLGKGLKGFSNETNGINPETVVAAANAAKALSEMMTFIPNEGGVAAWFAGEKSLSKFSGDLISLGKGLKGFATETVDINPETVTAAANAAKALAEMSNTIPNTGGIAAWFAGEKSVATFADELVNLGKGLKGFSDETTGVNPETITAASNSAKALGDMASVIPESTDHIIGFGDNLVDFGSSLSSYYENLGGVTKESVEGASIAVDAVRDLGTTINADGLKAAAKAIDEVVDSIRGMTKIDSGMVSEFRATLKKLGETNVDSFLKEFEGIGDDMKKAGKNSIKSFAEGVNDAVSTATKACKSLVSDCADAISDKASSFSTAGKQVVQGFADGISENTFKAEAQARAMAKAALQAAEEALGIESPSKEFYADGIYSGQGFVNGLAAYGSKTYKAGAAMANSAKRGLSDAISTVGDVINSDMDMQPTIRPVLDLSDVKAGAGTISSIFGDSTIAATADVGAVNAMMNRRNQNGNSDVVSAIDKLRKEVGSLEHTTYNINGVNYSEDSDVGEAIRTLIRATKMDRRS